jgi:MYXO-CTERM domain-containing protein
MRIGIVLVVFCLGIAGWEQTASANFVDAELTVACTGVNQMAVEVEVIEAEQNLFNGNERLEIGGTVLGTLSGLLATRSNLRAGDRILFATAAFAAAAGITPDVVMADTVVALFVAGAVVEFYGSFANLAGSLTLPAVLFATYAHSVAYGNLDLTVAALVLYSLAANAIIGTGDPVNGSPGGGGCSVANTGATPGSSILLLLTALGLATWRRRRTV